MIIVLLLLSALVVVGLTIIKRLNEMANDKKPNEEIMQIIGMLQDGSKEDRKVLLQNLQNTSENLNKSLFENTRALNERLDNAAKIISSVNKNVGEMSEIGRSMKDLQEFLKSPKLRGNIGEQVLNELLSQMLPKNSFHLQYAFKSGEKVDAAIKTSGGIVPIDSKFPMENFRKMMDKEGVEREKAGKDFVGDVKAHIKAISKKYINTGEGTIDYALMYIPSEAVYYEIVNNADLFEYSGKERVLPVSPTTFYAYMKAILMSFEGQKIEQQAREILSSLRAIQKDYDVVAENMGILQKHMTNATNMMNNVMSGFSILGQRISGTRRLGVEVEETRKLGD